MKPVGGLFSSGRRRAGGFGVAAVAIPTDHLDMGMGRQPLLDHVGGMLIQHVDHAVSLQVDDDGAVGASCAFGPLIDADHPRGRADGWGAPLHPPQEGVVADGEPNAVGQSFAGPSAERVPDQPGHHIRPTRAPAAEFGDARQAVGEAATRTRAGAAAPPTDTNLERDSRADGGRSFKVRT